MYRTPSPGEPVPPVPWLCALRLHRWRQLSATPDHYHHWVYEDVCTRCRKLRTVPADAAHDPADPPMLVPHVRWTSPLDPLVSHELRRGEVLVSLFRKVRALFRQGWRRPLVGPPCKLQDLGEPSWCAPGCPFCRDRPRKP